MSNAYFLSIYGQKYAQQRSDPGKKGAVGTSGSQPCCNQFRGLNLYRNTLVCDSSRCEITKVYKDNLSQCAAELCYRPTAKTILNNTVNGVTVPDTSYNYSSYQYLRRKCKSYETNNSTLEYDNITHTARSPCCNETCSSVVYKPSNTSFKVQGAVESSNRLERLKYETISRGRNGCCGTRLYSSQTQNIDINKKFPCSRRGDVLRQNNTVCN